jgi:hypothetical protein
VASGAVGREDLLSSGKISSECGRGGNDSDDTSNGSGLGSLKRKQAHEGRVVSTRHPKISTQKIRWLQRPRLHFGVFRRHFFVLSSSHLFNSLGADREGGSRGKKGGNNGKLHLDQSTNRGAECVMVSHVKQACKMYEITDVTLFAFARGNPSLQNLKKLIKSRSELRGRNRNVVILAAAKFLLAKDFTSDLFSQRFASM